MGLTPERDGEAVAESPLVTEAEPDFLIDGTERRRKTARTLQWQEENSYRQEFFVEQQSYEESVVSQPNRGWQNPR